MIYPKKNRFIHWFLHYYVKWAVGNHFREVLFNKVEVDKNRPVLLLANHFSFWDGLILYVVNVRLLKKNFHVMMGDDTAKGIFFLKYGGAFTIHKNSRQVLEALDYAAELLNDPQNLVLLYPQGKLYPNFVNDIRFEKGAQRIINRAGANLQLLFAATFIQYFKYKKPTATVYLNMATGDYAGKNTGKLKEAYQRHFNNAKLQQTEIDI